LYNFAANSLTMARKAKLGSGKRFKSLTKKLSRKGIKNPGALAAWLGRKRLGKAKFQKLAAAGRKRSAKRRKK
jgi:hypothetical protein